MKLMEDIFLVGSGFQGFGISNRFDCNVYLIDGGSEVALIDTGSGLDPDKIIDNINRIGVEPEKIKKLFLTHAHADHAGGVHAFTNNFQSEVYLHEAEVDALETADEEALALSVAKLQGYYPPDYKLARTDVGFRLKGGEILSVGKFNLEVIYTPGHSVGSVSYLLEHLDQRILFSGDYIFLGGKVNLLNCIGSSLEQYREHIHKLADLDLDCLMPGHFAFTLTNAQEHIDLGIKALEGLLVPPMVL